MESPPYLLSRDSCILLTWILSFQERISIVFLIDTLNWNFNAFLGVFLYESKGVAFPENIRKGYLNNLDLVFSLEQVIKTKKGVSTSVLKGVI